MKWHLKAKSPSILWKLGTTQFLCACSINRTLDTKKQQLLTWSKDLFIRWWLPHRYWLNQHKTTSVLTAITRHKRRSLTESYRMIKWFLIVLTVKWQLIRANHRLVQRWKGNLKYQKYESRKKKSLNLKYPLQNWAVLLKSCVRPYKNLCRLQQALNPLSNPK